MDLRIIGIIFFSLALGSIARAEESVSQKQAALLKEIEEFQKRGISIGKPMDIYIKFHQEKQLNVAPKILKMQVEHFSKAQQRKKTCSNTVNLKPPLSLSNPRDQDSENWCYGFTAADLIAHATGVLPSAAHMAILAPEYIRSPGDGYVGRFLSSSSRLGNCLESELPSDSYNFWKIAKYDVSKFKSLLEEFAKAQKNQSPDKIAQALCENDRLHATVTELFPQNSFMELAQTLAEVEEREILQEWVRRACKTKVSPALAKFDVKYVDRPHTHNWKELDKQLDQGNIIGIEFDSGMLKDHHVGLDVLNGHAVSLVGRSGDSSGTTRMGRRGR
jgi:hypothetical protein